MCGAANLMEILEISAAGGLQKNLVGVFPLCCQPDASEQAGWGDIIENPVRQDGGNLQYRCGRTSGSVRFFDNGAETRRKGVIDLATLTYSCHAALGDLTAGLFCNDDALCKEIEDAMAQSGERCWRMPLDDCYRDEIFVIRNR